MAVYLKPDKTKTWNGVTVHEKIIPDNKRWTKKKCEKFGFKIGDRYKACKPFPQGVQGITVHNTDWIKVNTATTPAEQYTRATFNENMSTARIHFYVDDKCAWQNLSLDEVGWHAGDSPAKTGGNYTTLGIEIIMDKTKSAYNTASYDNGARLCAYLLHLYGFGIDKLYTHTYWINERDGYKKTDKDEQCTYKYPKVYKYCPSVILRDGWKQFEAKVQTYLNALNNESSPTPDSYVIGDRVTISENAVYTNNVKVPSRYIGKPYTVMKVKPTKILIKELNSWIAPMYLTKCTP